MPRYIAFLRAINVGGRIVKMDALKNEFESLGLAKVETFIASGNVIFDSRAGAGALESKIEKRLAATLGYDVHTFIRTPREIAAIASYTPFSPAVMKSAKALNVAFIREPMGAELAKRLALLKTEMDDFHTNAREVYWVCKRKQSESKFSNALFERKLGISATFRGLNTVQRLAALYPVASSGNE
jgi:uncharacterized protein (DUF1697 family)